MTSGNFPIENTLLVLKQVEIFAHVPASVMEEIAKRIHISTFQPEETIINKGDKGNSMYIIFTGEVKVHDREYVVATMKDGNFFGEFSLLDDEPRSLSVTAIAPTVTGTIEQKDFFQLQGKYPDVTRDIIRAMLKRLRGQNQKIISDLRQRQAELEQLVTERTSDLQTKNGELIETLSELKRTQEQLVQQEKLASLGQLTAGIAHEIQNPLNFVNNFSFLSKDLMRELAESKDDEDRKEILDLLSDNIHKIEHHGKRAGDIVKSMLQHSQPGSRTRQPVNINKLFQDCCEISFHSFKDNGIELGCKIIKNFTTDLPQVEMVAQDFSKVLLNLLNNAFYAVRERKQADSSTSYVPEVILTTGFKNNVLTISVKDNGTGIKSVNLPKIFEPFYTTKPTGFGNTGLGLSITNDIVKAHGGKIMVESKENEFTEFIINLSVPDLKASL
jgi:signal transduction histidine kinase